MSSKISYKGKNSHIKKRFSFIEGGHQLEKLEFALAVAQTKGDGKKSEILKKKIVELGGSIEELAGCDQTVLKAGEAVTVITPTAGGWGKA